MRYELQCIPQQQIVDNDIVTQTFTPIYKFGIRKSFKIIWLQQFQNISL